MTHSFSEMLPLHTDFYQLTMAYSYWKCQKHDEIAVFHLYFRKIPFSGGYVVAAGLATALDYIRSYRFSQENLTFLRGQKNGKGTQMFEENFLKYLASLQIICRIDAVAEGQLVFPYEPILRIEGPILQCQLLETSLLNMIGFQSLIATKASRICYAAGQMPVFEFGLRRAQSLQGAKWASRAAYLAGAAATSNVAAAHDYQIPLVGTHAHSWIMSFSTETEAFRKYAQIMPHDCVLLVDTYDTQKGIEHAVEIGRCMASEGKKLKGIRIDSGDLAYFSKRARTLLDAANLHQVQIIVSGDLNEYIIESLRRQGAAIDAWGVGTHLTTSYEQPSLGVVYKLSAMRQDSRWKEMVKVSGSSEKINIPGRLQVQRFVDTKGTYVADMICDTRVRKKLKYTIIDPLDPLHRKTLRIGPLSMKALLKSIPLSYTESLEAIRERHKEMLKRLDDSIQRLVNPHIYPAGLEEQLYKRRAQMIIQHSQNLTPPSSLETK